MRICKQCQSLVSTSSLADKGLDKLASSFVDISRQFDRPLKMTGCTQTHWDLYKGLKREPEMVVMGNLIKGKCTLYTRSLFH